MDIDVFLQYLCGIEHLLRADVLDRLPSPLTVSGSVVRAADDGVRTLTDLFLWPLSVVDYPRDPWEVGLCTAVDIHPFVVLLLERIIFLVVALLVLNVIDFPLPLLRLPRPLPCP